MEIKITKWGNSLGVRLPKSILDDLNIKEGESLSIEKKNRSIILKKNEYDEFIIKDLAEGFYGKPFIELKNVISEKELDWGENIGEEVW